MWPFYFRSERQLKGHPVHVSEKGSSNRYTIFDWSLSGIVRYRLFSLLPPLLRDRRLEQVFGYAEHPGIVDLCTYVFNQIKPLI